MTIHIAKRMAGVPKSLIREIAEKAANTPNVISFANGNPSDETYQSALFAQFASEGFTKDTSTLCDYGKTLGYEPLRNELKEYLTNRWCFDFKKNEVMITAGGQQSCDYITKVLLDETEAVITEEPSYSSCYNTFRAYRGKLIGVQLEEDGMNIEQLKRAIIKNPNARIIYLIPNFQNPTGYTYSLEKRKKIYALAKEYNLAIFEDDPYGELKFEGEDIPPIKSLDIDGRVLYGGSFSKTIAPGLRVGYLVFDKELVSEITIAKQTTDICIGLINQYIVYRCLIDNFGKHLEECRKIYRHKRNIMIQRLKEKAPEGLTWNHPKGGFFLTVFFPQKFDTYEFAFTAIGHGVATIPGASFYIDSSVPCNSLRLCYSTSSDEEIISGVDALCSYARVELSKKGVY